VAGNLYPVISALLLAVAWHQDEPVPRLRTELPNGTKIFVERSATPNSVVVELYASNVASVERSNTHGYRHLVEHFASRGKDRTLDRRLESKGLFLTAVTSRDGMAIQISGPAEHIGLAMEGLLEVANHFEATEEQIVREVQIMAEEFALVSPLTKLANVAWEGFFADKGLDPFGTIEAMKSATPDSLADAHKMQFHPSGLAVVAVGDLNVDAVMNRLKEGFQARTGGTIEGELRLGDDAPAKLSAKVAGEARSVMIAGFPDVSTLATLAGGLAFQSELPGTQVVFTPTTRPGVISLTCRDAGVLAAIDRLGTPERAVLVGRARSMLVAYLRSQASQTSSYVHLRALLLRDSPGVTPDDLIQQASLLTTEQILNGMARFNRGECLQVAG